MTTEEKLEKIEAKCRAFLELAEKRTPGEWLIKRCTCGHPKCRYCWPGPMMAVQGTGYSPADATFIAACAGQAEAMARSTIAAIELILSLDGFYGIDISGLNATRDIIAACPEEIL